MREITYNPHKLRELIVYVAAKTANKPFGDTKMNKTIYYADFEAYRRLGRSITGASYHKLDFGPAPKAFFPVREELRREGAVTVKERSFGNLRQRVTRAARDPDSHLFDGAELAIINEVIERLRPLSAKAVSDMSHEEPGWKLVEMREDVPYWTALISDEPASENVLARARARATGLGW